LKALYGLVQAAQQFFLKFKSIMKKIGLCENVAEPCMLMKGEKNDLTVAVVHVHDCYVIGNDKSLKDVVDQVQEHGWFTGEG
jgi:hypothetical protein